MIKIFNKWSVEGIAVADTGVADYITLDPKIVPKTGARYAGQKFHKSKVFIVERLINKIMVPGHRGKKHFRSSGQCCGKKSKAYNAVEKAFGMIELRLKKNPVEVFVTGLVNACPREEIVSIEYGGARYPKSVEVGSQRRIDLVLRYMVQGAYGRSFRSKISIEQALADEIIGAFQRSAKSNAISKKRDLERQAASAK
ncbi:MAG TPA: 30S ribosomal protein S7 [Candidatus Nanoarchaeia archaeon]|nr:30S ribosomal protein S7 [Candidatus Nanoarchaeia archaeon]